MLNEAGRILRLMKPRALLPFATIFAICLCHDRLFDSDTKICYISDWFQLCLFQCLSVVPRLFLFYIYFIILFLPGDTHNVASSSLLLISPRFENLSVGCIPVSTDSAMNYAVIWK